MTSDLATELRRLLDARAVDATICPSEVARAVAGDDEAAWRALMEPVRAVVAELVAAGEVEVTQRGEVVDPAAARGPIRIRYARD